MTMYFSRTVTNLVAMENSLESPRYVAARVLNRVSRYSIRLYMSHAGIGMVIGPDILRHTHSYTAALSLS